jgi:TnpA family transposase
LDLSRIPAGDINARYGRDPGLSFYTHLSDQHGPYSIKVMSATNHEASVASLRC